MEKKHLEVVAAVITNKDKIFIAQRGKGKSLEGKWEFPGGKIEKDETKEEALIREIREELNSEIKVVSFITSTFYDYGDFSVTIHFFYASLVHGKLISNEHQNTKWIDIKDLHDFDFAPADESALIFITDNYS